MPDRQIHAKRPVGQDLGIHADGKARLDEIVIARLNEVGLRERAGEGLRVDKRIDAVIRLVPGVDLQHRTVVQLERAREIGDARRRQVVRRHRDVKGHRPRHAVLRRGVLEPHETTVAEVAARIEPQRLGLASRAARQELERAEIRRGEVREVDRRIAGLVRREADAGMAVTAQLAGQNQSCVIPDVDVADRIRRRVVRIIELDALNFRTAAFQGIDRARCGQVEGIVEVLDCGR